MTSASGIFKKLLYLTMTSVYIRASQWGPNDDHDNFVFPLVWIECAAKLPETMRILNLIKKIYRGMTPRRYAYLVALSTVAHVLVVLLFDHHPGIDGPIYQGVAWNIIASPDPLACGAFCDAFWPPLFCIYLSLFYAVFGSAHWLYFLFNIAILLATTLISRIYLERIFGPLVGRWSTFLFYNSMIMYYTTFYFKYELITALLLSLSLFYVTRTRGSDKAASMLGGLFLGLAALATGRVLALVPALIYYLYKKTGAPSSKWMRSVPAASLLIGITLSMSPWVVRNYICFDRFIPVTVNSGLNCYLGFNPIADGSGRGWENCPPPYNNWEREDAAFYYRGALQFIKDNPGRSLVLMLKKVNLLWRIHYADMALILPFFYFGIFILGRLVPPERKHSARMIQFIILGYTVFHCLFIARFYYAVPVLPVVFGVAVATQRYLGCKLER